MTLLSTVAWNRLDTTGTDSASLHADGLGFSLMGEARLSESTGPIRLQYSLRTYPDWTTEVATVLSPSETRNIDIVFRRSAEGEWRVNGRPRPEIRGCFDIDFSFTPATNVLPLRRLALSVGGSADVMSAWLSYPDLDLRPLTQTYKRLDRDSYLYKCPELAFESLLTVDPESMIRDYPPIWTRAD